jgi:drug/metabolite transporter (DMT)-like permease
VWDGPAIGVLLYLTVIGSAVSFTLYYWLLAYLPAKRLALIAYLIPLIAVTIGTARGERLTTRILLGSATVIAGVALALHIDSRRKRAGSG